MSENYVPVKVREDRYSQLIQPYVQPAFEALKKYVAIDSVYDEATRSETMPFGAGVEKALAFTAELGKELGFKVDRCDNYITELTAGEGEKVFDIYAHADTVPVNRKNWTRDPFALTQEGDVLYGRGTNDDKGPGIACLFAVKALMDLGKVHGFKLRFLFGGNEERDSLGLHHYFHVLKKGYPTYGISPDADYPVIYAEKSIYAYEERIPFSDPRIEPFEIGSALNIVPDEAKVRIQADGTNVEEAVAAYQSLYPRLKIRFEDGVLSVKGISAHGSLPWLGENAGLHLLNLLGKIYGLPVLEEVAHGYEGGKGENRNVNFKDKTFDGSSYNVGKIRYDGKVLSLDVNFRFPCSYSVQDVVEAVRKASQHEILLLGGSDGFVQDKDSDFVQILVGAYREETGDEKSEPLAIGGGTYARESRNSVAFGAAFPGRSMRMHGDDEFFPYSDFVDNIQIYARALDEMFDYLRTGKRKA